MGKAIVMGVLSRNTMEDIPDAARKRSKRDSQVRAIVLPELKKTHTDAHLKPNVEAGSTVFTDEGAHYNSLPDYEREFIDHTETYVRCRVHVNGVGIFGCRTFQSNHTTCKPTSASRPFVLITAKIPTMNASTRYWQASLATYE